MNIELYDENNESKRDAFNEVARRRFRVKRSETRATAEKLMTTINTNFVFTFIFILSFFISYGQSNRGCGICTPLIINFIDCKYNINNVYEKGFLIRKNNILKLDSSAFLIKSVNSKNKYFITINDSIDLELQIFDTFNNKYRGRWFYKYILIRIDSLENRFNCIKYRTLYSPIIDRVNGVSKYDEYIAFSKDSSRKTYIYIDLIYYLKPYEQYKKIPKKLRKEFKYFWIYKNKYINT
jgi:hypothetical protein